MLWGTRADDGLETTPAGHANPGEPPNKAARRELFEEAGILVPLSALVHLATVQVPDGPLVSAFRVDLPAQVQADSSQDPDHEVPEWRWESVAAGLPERIRSRLHVPRHNVLLDALGLAYGDLSENMVKAELTKARIEVENTGNLTPEQHAGAENALNRYVSESRGYDFSNAFQNRFRAQVHRIRPSAYGDQYRFEFHPKSGESRGDGRVDYPRPEGAVDEIPHDPKMAYRGMSHEEWQEALGRGHIASRGQHNMQGQEGLTFYAEHPNMATSYASGFSPWMHRPGTEAPGVVVAVPRHHLYEKGQHPGLDDTHEELATDKPIPLSEVRGVWKVHPAAARPVHLDLNHDYLAGKNEVSEGSRSGGTQGEYVVPAMGSVLKAEAEPRDIVVCIPADRLAQVEAEEAAVAAQVAAGHKAATYYWTVHALPRMQPRRVYFVWGGAVRAWHDCVGMTDRPDPRLLLDHVIHSIQARPIDSFRGWRYFTTDGMKAPMKKNEPGRLPLVKADLAPSKPKKVATPKAPPEKNLIVQHNLSEAGLANAHRMGGLPAPSLAVSHRDRPLTNFGEISLVGHSGLADPKAKVPLYDADVYSPRYPRARHDVDEKAYRKLESELKPHMEQVGAERRGFDDTELRDQLATNKPQDLVHYRSNNVIHALGLAYLQSHGKPLKANLRPKNQEHEWAGEMQDYARTLPRHVDYGSKEHGELSRKSGEAIDSYFRKKYGNKPIVDDVIEATRHRIGLDNPDGRMHFNQTHRVVESALNAGQVEPDYHDLHDRIHAQVDEDPGFHQYLHDKLSPLQTNEHLLDGKRKLPHTLDNVMKLMTRTIRGGEGKSALGAAPGHARSMGAKRFRSLDDARKESGRLTSRDDMGEAKKDFGNRLHALASKMPATSMGDASDLIASFLKHKSMSRALAETGYKPGEIDSDTQDEIRELAQHLVKMPSEYFEAKPQRIVKLNEFRGAAVPHDAKPETLAALRHHGLDVEHYQRGNHEDRKRAIQTLADKHDLKLSEDTDLAKAISSLGIGRKAKTKRPGQGFEQSSYSHLLPPEVKGQGYQLMVEDRQETDGTRKLRAFLQHPSGKHGQPSANRLPGEVGQVTGMLHPEDGLEVGESDLAQAHKNKKLGRAMYEALYSHAHNVHGATKAYGTKHSTEAMRVHRSLADRHGLAYEPQPDFGPDADNYENEKEWRRAPTGPFDEKYKAYEYALKSEEPRGKAAIRLLAGK